VFYGWQPSVSLSIKQPFKIQKTEGMPWTLWMSPWKTFGLDKSTLHQMTSWTASCLDIPVYPCMPASCHFWNKRRSEYQSTYQPLWKAHQLKFLEFRDQKCLGVSC
jgi:hypothetical protein